MRGGLPTDSVNVVTSQVPPNDTVVEPIPERTARTRGHQSGEVAAARRYSAEARSPHLSVMTMRNPNIVLRRTFFGCLAALGATLTGVAALPSVAGAQGPTHPADAWLDELTGQHKNIYDCTSVENGPNGWAFARNFLTANTGPIYQLKESDLNIIVCLRHLATVFSFNDAMWTKYKLGESQLVNESGVAAVRNAHASTATELAKRGVIVAVCGMATGRIARQTASRDGLNAADVEADLRANLVTPTARVVAAGVIVTNRAQEKGFTYNYVG